jgi:HEAT repeat protein
MTSLLLLIATMTPGAEPKAQEPPDRVVIQLADLAADSRQLPAARMEAIKTLGKLGPEAAPAAAKLAGLLSRLPAGEMPSMQEAIVVTLGRIGAASRPFVPVMLRAVGQDMDIDHEVSRAVNRIMIEAESLEVDVLIKQLGHKDPSMRLRAAKALTSKGVHGDAAAHSLILLLQDPDPDIRRVAASALRAVRPDLKESDIFVPAYIMDMQDRDENIRISAARSLGRLGPAAAAAIPALQKAAQSDQETEVRHAATEALTKIAPQ